MSYISSAGFTPELTIVKVHIRHTNLVPEIEVKESGYGLQFTFTTCAKLEMTSHDKHSNNSDTSQDLLALKRRGIDPFDGIDDDKGSKWHLFKDQLAPAERPA